MQKSKRITHRTDNRGNVLEQHTEAFDLQALENARTAGVPAFLLDPAGWTGNEDLRGYFAECIYTLGDYLSSVETDMGKVGGVITLMEQAADYFGFDRREAIPYSGARLLRQLSEAKDRRAAIERGDVLPLATEVEVCWGQW